MNINQEKISKFRSLNKWTNCGVILGFILSSLLIIFSISMICILSVGINTCNNSVNNLFTVTIFSILIVIFLLFAIGAIINITYTALYLLDKQENTLLIAILNLIFAFGIAGYLILHGDNLKNKTLEA